MFNKSRNIPGQNRFSWHFGWHIAGLNDVCRNVYVPSPPSPNSFLHHYLFRTLHNRRCGKPPDLWHGLQLDVPPDSALTYEILIRFPSLQFSYSLQFRIMNFSSKQVVIAIILIPADHLPVNVPFSRNSMETATLFSSRKFWWWKWNMNYVY